MSDTLQRIKALDQASRLLDPGPEERQAMNEKVLAEAETFLIDIEERPSFIKSPEASKEILAEPFSEESVDLSETLALYDRAVNRTGINPASGGHLGYIPGGGIYTSALGDYIAAYTNRYAGIFFGNPGAVRMENMLVRWCADLVDFPAEAAGALLSGGSIANLSCIVTARDAKGIKSADIHRSVIYMTQQVHHCVDKAFNIAGLREAIVRHVPMDEQFRMSPTALRELIESDLAAGLKPFLVVASTGTTDTGAIDPVDEIAPIAHELDCWLHVDAAYGGFFVLCEEGKKRIKGLGEADSIVMDPHKGLFLPYGSGVAIVKDGQLLANSHHYTANYMLDALRGAEEASPADLSPELTKHFRGMRMWLPLKIHGVAPFRACVEEKLWLTKYFWERLEDLPYCERGPEPDLSVALYRFCPPGWDPNDFNTQLINRCHADGRVFISSTLIDGDSYLRLACLSFRTHLETIEKCLAMLEEHVVDLVGEND